MKEKVLLKILKRINYIILSLTSICLVAGCNQSNDNGQSQSSDQPTSEENTDHGTTTTDDNEQKTNNYSDLLNNVLSNSTYCNLIDSFKKDLIDERSPYFDPNPYNFYKDQGFSVNSIKSGILYASTKAYTIETEPNNLYMITYCADNSNTYYNEFLLRYHLTDKEMADYKMLHENRYVQAVFMNDAISATRSPEILSEAKCSIEAHNNLSESLDYLSYTKTMLGIKGVDVLFKEFNITEKTFSVYVFPNVGYAHPDRMTSTGKFGTYYLKRGREALNIENNVFTAPSNYGEFAVNKNLFNVDNPAEHAIDVTWYYSQYANLYARYIL